MTNLLSVLVPALSAAACCACLTAQSSDHPSGIPASVPQAAAPPPFALTGSEALAPMPWPVVFDRAADGRLWAAATTYKASFGTDGFVYVPFFGSDAPQNYPVRFRLRGVRVGGQDLAIASEAPAMRDGDRVTFDRGAVRESYDLTIDRVEQTFVVETGAAGDVDLEIDVETELVEDAGRPGLQWGNQLGEVEYGTAYSVAGSRKREIPAAFDGRTLRLHVPASHRDGGPVVIDPSIGTNVLTPTLMRSDGADVAYDATTDHWAVAWIHVFSATDHDVVAEIRDGAGKSVPGGFRAIETSTESYSAPHIGNLASADRFLITMERYDAQQRPGQQYSLWAKTLNAATPFAVGSSFLVTPASSMDPRGGDVGGDPGTGTAWIVVWSENGDIVGRQVDATGNVSPGTIPIEKTNAFCYQPSISLSNGNGWVATPQWCVVYMLYVDGSNRDVYGSTIDASGSVLRSHSSIETGTADDLYPFVSSPLFNVPGAPAFAVSYERQQATGPEMLVNVVDAGFVPLAKEVNLTRRYGYSGIYCRVESDGARIAATCSISAVINVGTLALAGNDLVLHEALQYLGGGGNPNIASKRSGGGVNTEYAIVWTSSSYNPSRTVLARYDGRTPTGGINSRGNSCDLYLNYSGEPYLGRSMQFSLQNAGSEPAGLLLGFPGPETPVCPQCTIGLDLAKTLITLPASTTLQLPAPSWLVGQTLSLQGYAVGSGTCLGGLRLTRTYDLTVQ